MKLLLLSTVALVFVVSCSNQKKPSESNSAAVLPTEGKALLEANCYACHNPNAKSHDDLLAPPFAAIKKRYQMQYNNEADFVAAIMGYVPEPDSSKVLMRGAINEFGLMPPMPLEPVKIEQIARYLYNNDPAEPEWFKEHFEEQHGEQKRRMTN